MPSIILTERQLELITDNISKEKKVVNEAWYNTVMDFLGIVDPTPIVDTINSISYFSQGETLFGILTLIAALPMYVGDVATKPVMMALKTGSTATKELESALKIKSKKLYMEMQPGDVTATFADVKALEKHIQFKPSTSIKRGVASFIEWYKQYYSI